MPRSSPRISVILPCLNDSKYIKEAINSVINQDYEDYELLVIDGGSTDGTIQIVESFSDERITLLDGGGFVESLNKGIEIARGQYIARIDSDSISHPTRFRKQIQFLDSHEDVVAVGSAVRRIDCDSGDEYIDRKPTTHEEIEKKLVDASSFAHPTVMMRRSTIRECGMYKDYTWEDYELWTRLLKFKLANLDEVLVTEYEREESIQENVSPLKSISANTVCGLLAIHRSSLSIEEKIRLYVWRLLVFPKKLAAKILHSH